MPNALPFRSHSACSSPASAGHQNRAAAVEAAAIRDLPDILDPARVMADEAVAQRLERAVHGLGPASRLASPQPTAPFSVSTRTNSQRGGT
jgi:hypothetical protein